MTPTLSWRWQEPLEIGKAKGGVPKAGRLTPKKPSQLPRLMAIFPAGWLAHSSASSCLYSLNPHQQRPRLFGRS